MTDAETYTCDNCHQEFIDDTSKEERIKECIEAFGYLPPEQEQARVCDDCYKKMTAEVPPAEFNIHEIHKPDEKEIELLIQSDQEVDPLKAIDTDGAGIPSFAPAMRAGLRRAREIRRQARGK